MFHRPHASWAKAAWLTKSISCLAALESSSASRTAGILAVRQIARSSSSWSRKRSLMTSTSALNASCGAHSKSSLHLAVRKPRSSWRKPVLKITTLIWSFVLWSTRFNSELVGMLQSSMAFTSMENKGIFQFVWVLNLHRAVHTWSRAHEWWWSGVSSEKAYMPPDNQEKPLLPHAALCMRGRSWAHTVRGLHCWSRSSFTTLWRVSLWDGLWVGSLHYPAWGDSWGDQCRWGCWQGTSIMEESALPEESIPADVQADRNTIKANRCSRKPLAHEQLTMWHPCTRTCVTHRQRFSSRCSIRSRRQTMWSKPPKSMCAAAATAAPNHTRFLH